MRIRHTSARDAFGRSRVGNPTTKLDIKQVFDNAPLMFDTALTGSGTATWSKERSSTRMAVTNDGDRVIRQTFQSTGYQPGKSHNILKSVRMPTFPGVISRAWYGDGVDGFYFENNAGVLSWNVMNDGVLTEQAFQKDNPTLWNVSPMIETLDMGGNQILDSDMEWLGIGSLQCGGVYQRERRPHHLFIHENDPIFEKVYIRNPCLPVRFELISTGGSGYMDHICCSVVSEGGADAIGINRTVSCGMTSIGVTNQIKPLCAIRIKESYRGAMVTPIEVEVSTTSNQEFEYGISIEPIITGAFTWDTTHNPNSCCDVISAITSGTPFGTQTIANRAALGTVLGIGYTSTSSRLAEKRINNSLRIGHKIDGTPQILVLWANAGTTTNIKGVMGWKEGY